MLRRHEPEHLLIRAAWEDARARLTDVGRLVGLLERAAGAVTLELAASPPWWVHAILWVPLTLAGVILSLRLAKGWLLALEYRNAAREGKVDPGGTPPAGA